MKFELCVTNEACGELETTNKNDNIINDTIRTNDSNEINATVSSEVCFKITLKPQTLSSFNLNTTIPFTKLIGRNNSHDGHMSTKQAKVLRLDGHVV